MTSAKHKKKKIKAGEYEYRGFVLEDAGYCPPLKRNVWIGDLTTQNTVFGNWYTETSLKEIMSKVDDVLDKGIDNV